MPRTAADRTCISIYEAAKLDLARCRCLPTAVIGRLS